MEISSNVLIAFSDLKSNHTVFALPLELSNNTLQALPPIHHPKTPNPTFQQSLNQLEDILSPKKALYIILCRDTALIVITYLPYLASADSKNAYLTHQTELLQRLGPTTTITSSLLCKEPGEITDARSWDERDGDGESWNAGVDSKTDCADCADCATSTHDAISHAPTYKKNKCRLCDRRMKNPIAPDALAALQMLAQEPQPGAFVQLSIPSPTPTPTLTLTTPPTHLAPATLLQYIPRTHPSFTFYTHPTSRRTVFIFYSPDSATVQARMTHTMAIPGLVNVIAKDAGVGVRRKIEVHEVGEVVDELREEEEGIDGEGGEGRKENWKGRSVYLLGGRRGTESVWEGMEGA